MTDLCSACGEQPRITDPPSRFCKACRAEWENQAQNRWEAEQQTVSHQRQSRAVLATQSGICPLCSKFIAKNLSPIVALPEPLTPRTLPPRWHGEYTYTHSYDDGGNYYADGRSISLSPRAWAHERCAERWVERRAEGRQDEPLWK